MAELIYCPQCQRQLRVPDELLGRHVKCPSCGLQFTAALQGGSLPGTAPQPASLNPPPATSPAAGAPFGFYEEAPSYRRDAGDADMIERPDPFEMQGLGRVRIGTTLVAAAVCIFAGIAFLGEVAGWIMAPQPPAAPGAPQVLFGCLAAIAALTSFCLFITGQVLWLSAPNRHGAKPLAQTSIGLSAALIIMFILAIVFLVTAVAGIMNARNPNFEDLLRTGMAGAIGGLILLGLAFLLYLAAQVVNLFFLRAMALVVQAPRLAQSISYLLFFFGIFAVIAIANSVIEIAAIGAARRQPIGAGPAPFVAGGMWSVLDILQKVLVYTYFIWLIVSLFQVRNVIDAYMRTSRYGTY